MKTILFVHQSAELYGSDKTLLVLIKHLDKAKFKAVVIVPFNGPLKPVLEAHGADVYIAPVLKLHRSMFSPQNMLLFLKQVKAAVHVADELNKKYKFNIIYSNTLAVLLGMIYARKRKIKHVWHVHEIINHPKSIAAIFPQLLKRYAQVVICNSVATKSNLTGRVKSLEGKSVVVYNGVDEPNRVSAVSRESMGFKETDVVITLVGRISRLKGHKLMLEAFCNYLQKYENLKLFFVGSPVPGQEFYLTDIQQLIEEKQIEEKVKIKPFTSNLQDVWDATDIAVMPSTEAESFGLVALEAMLQKKPVIGSGHGGLAEIIVDGKTGFLSRPGDALSLASCLERLINDTALRIKFGNAGYIRATNEFSEVKYAENIQDILIRL